MISFRIATATCAICMATSAFAKPPLKDVEYVREGVIATGIAFEISENCEKISARMLRGLFFLNDLKRHAQGLGYSSSEIDAYVNDSEEKARLVTVARARLADLGATSEDPESYCSVGRTEIAQESQIGRLLR